ncbi:MAG: EI24 domain-containing protein [Victivallales bacterium]|nr:EI24 domain-containing protein [Victivallales bacterium]
MTSPKKNVNHFLRGMQYAFTGLRDFYSRPHLWKYAAIPLLILGTFYFGITWWFFSRFLPGLLGSLANRHEWLRFVVKWGAIFLFGSLLTSLASSFYECLGSIFFSALVRRFESEEYHFTDGYHLSFLQDLRNTFSCIVYSALTFLLLLVLTAMSISFPILGHIILTLGVGYRYAISYMSEAGFNHNKTLSELSAIYARKNYLLYGFGAITYVLLLIPVLSLFFAPGFVLAGTRIVNEE